MVNEWGFFPEYASSDKYTSLGCSPELMTRLIDWLHSLKGKAAQIDVALYLFNNRELYKALYDLAEASCRVTVYSIPLEGYDNSCPVPIYDAETYRAIGEKTKYQLANELYSDIIANAPHCFALRIVPHMYLRSCRVKPFSRGEMPYSLHCKSLLVQNKDGTYYAALTSSNLAVRDASKHEVAFVARLDNHEVVSSVDFYEGLYENSIDIRTFDSKKDYSHYRVKKRAIPHKSHFMYLAPFYHDSAKQFGVNVSTIIKNAKKRIIVCAQHISAYEYSYERAYTAAGEPYGTIRTNGFLRDVLRKSTEGVATFFLSQTYADVKGNYDGRKPKNGRAFSEFIFAAEKSNCCYFVNKNVHSKFIVVDDVVLITTCNFTPTQFIYLDNVSIPEFDNIPGFSYSGIHCEVGLYFAIKNQELADQVINFFELMIEDRDTERMF